MRTLGCIDTICTALALFLPPVLPTATAGQTKIPTVGVVVRNFNAVPARMLEKAEMECEQVYRAAGVRVAWLNSLEPVAWDGPDVVLQAVILRQAPPSRVLAAFGTALRDRKEVLLYQDRIVRFARPLNLPPHTMLSLALVHELGHLLLDSDEHTGSGIMRGEWDQDDVNAIRRGDLRFTSNQVQRIQTYIGQRGSSRVR